METQLRKVFLHNKNMQESHMHMLMADISKGNLARPTEFETFQTLQYINKQKQKAACLER